MYTDILNSYVLDFYTRNLWENINGSWKKSFESFSTTHLSNFLDKNSNISEEEYLSADIPWQSPDIELSSEWLIYQPRFFRVQTQKVVIDVGSGQGHLARLTSYGFGIPTMCIDAEENFINGARKFDLELESSLKRTCSKKIVGPRHGTFRLHPDLTKDDFEEILKDTWPDLTEEKNNSDKGLPFSLVGLHCCGDLGPILLRLFASIPSCRSILLVGCCYMKLSSKSERENSEGYPMSRFVNSRENGDLSYTAKEMACHALEGYSSRLMMGVDQLKVHCYRAVLEELIVQKRADLTHSGLRSVKNAHLLSFRNYALKAISRLEGMSFEDEELATEVIEIKLKDWMKVVIFYSIRLMLAPAVESLILLDRLLYINENSDAKCCFVPIFDPELSPRNYSLIATKD
ncbi:Protein RRNAD1 [Armadillidium nasatum]|uniref:Protein RRNAD1 n=1 Tax=Armadillidium nasatum TaxID=96803 RepID=A0A5N5SYD4_9CRUS|nr:Protein RRNAD1 [Armadillidium nasatum]